MAASTLTAEEILESLTRVVDPGAGVNIVDLGLIYGIDLNRDIVTIEMTLRSPSDPFRSQVESEVEQTLKLIHPELSRVFVDLIWEPEWHENFMTDEGRQQIASPIVPFIPTPDAPLTIEVVLDSLRHVIDPEVGINIVDLGLIYRLDLPSDAIEIEMTMTTPACPLQATIESAVRRILALRHPEISRVGIAVVWDPPWSVNRISPAGRIALGWGAHRVPGARSRPGKRTTRRFSPAGRLARCCKSIPSCSTCWSSSPPLSRSCAIPSCARCNPDW